MANVKVAINGFGRIGRLAFRQMFGAKGYQVVAINDLTKPSMLAHLLKYDTAQGRYNHDVVADYEASTITVDGKTIQIYSAKAAAHRPWKCRSRCIREQRQPSASSRGSSLRPFQRRS